MTEDFTWTYPYLASGGFSGLAGFLAGYAIKKVLKIGMVIVGSFFTALMYVNYQGYITVNWVKISNATQIAAQQGLHQLTTIANSTAAQFPHSNVSVSGIPMTMVSFFMFGLAGGLMKG